MSLMRYLAIDLGDKRTGLALGDGETRLATPMGVVEIPMARSDGRALLDALAGEIDAQTGVDAPAERGVGLCAAWGAERTARLRLRRRHGSWATSSVSDRSICADSASCTCRGAVRGQSRPW